MKDIIQAVLLYTVITVVPGFLLALPPAINNRSWTQLLSGIVLSAFGIVLPLMVFFGSTFFLPDWKGGCTHGWLDCFHSGKLVLTPLVLWACCAFYVEQILRPAGKQSWVDLGLFIGAIISSICFVIGVVIHGSDTIRWGLAIPLYTALWYWILSLRLIKVAPPQGFSYLLTSLSTLPFWAASIWVSMDKYRSLPETAPDCFIVTAASRGHPNLVGPFMATRHRSGIRSVNRQLSTFWRLEEVWRRRFPRGHQRFRRIYNRIGPLIARSIKSPWTADIVFLLLKPAECIATIILSGTASNGKGREHN